MFFKNASVKDLLNVTVGGSDREQNRAIQALQNEQKDSRLKSGSYIDPIASAKAFHTIYNYEKHQPLPEENPSKSNAFLSIQNARRYGYGGGNEEGVKNSQQNLLLMKSLPGKYEKTIQLTNHNIK